MGGGRGASIKRAQETAPTGSASGRDQEPARPLERLGCGDGRAIMGRSSVGYSVQLVPLAAARFVRPL